MCILDERFINNKQRIIDESIKIIMEKGVENTSLADIANKVGISKGTLYYYYNSKSDLIYDITIKHLNEVTKEILDFVEKMSSKSPPKEMVLMLYDRILNEETRGKLHIYLIQEALTKNKNLQTRFKYEYRSWRGMIEEGLNKIFKGRIHDYEVLSYIILSSLDGLIIQRLIGFEDIPTKKIACYLSKMDFI